MSSAREKVQRLMALALSPGTPVEEARTAAMAALKMIDEHKLLEQPPAPPPQPAPPPPPQPPPRQVRVEVVGEKVHKPNANYDPFDFAPSPPPDLDWLFDDDDEDPNGVFFDPTKKHKKQNFEHTVATPKHYPTHRVLNEFKRCCGCGNVIAINQLAVVELDLAGKEVFWHRPCWDRGTNG